jgi:hypothetical protein
MTKMKDASPASTAQSPVERTRVLGHQASDSSRPWIAILVLVLLPVLFNAIALFPEVRNSTPSGNDQVFHYLFIERADQAISAGDNPVDHWLPQLELGFPEFLYYQNVPHLVVVGLYRLLLQQVSLLRLLNLIRYLLMVAFPLTVYWSMRTMGFSFIAAATGAMFSPMLSSRVEYGFDFNSYVWRGVGMFPQLCAMHLLFLGTACVRRVLERGRGFAAAIVASAALVLSDLLYAYMFAVMLAILWLLSIVKDPAPTKRNLSDILRRLKRSTTRLAIVTGPLALITAYQTIPFFADIQYFNRSLPRSWKGHPISLNMGHEIGVALAQVQYLSMAMPFTLPQLWVFFGGHFFDNNRLPVVTCLVIVGVFYSLMTRSEEAKLAMAILIVWMTLLVPNSLRVIFATHMPLANFVPFFRFVSGVDFGAILTVGLGGECIWRWCNRVRSSRVRVLAPIILLVVLYAPVMFERWSFYLPSANAMELTDQALQNDTDLLQVISSLQKAPPGRVYAGTRGNWGLWMKIGRIHLYDLLPVEQFATVMPWQTLSLNAPLLWQLDIPSQAICRLFDIRYVVAPPEVKLPDYYRPSIRTPRYIVYEVDSGGYLQLGWLTKIKRMGSSEYLFRSNKRWLDSEDPAEEKFTAFLPVGENPDPELAALLDRSAQNDRPSQLGAVTNEVITPDSLSARVTATSSALLIIKVTYHPNWHVTVDGQTQRTFMVSPSFIGAVITPGDHQIRAEYKSSGLKKFLLLIACICLAATIISWIFGFELWLRDTLDDRI